jgi:hypothetical protein
MRDETDHDKVIRLEEKLSAAAQALKLAYDNNHAVRAEMIAFFSLLLAAYAVYKGR